jgi:DNA repair exonuclease SbcCD ATPase subunit
MQRAVELESFYKAEIRRTENVRSMDQDSGQGSKIDKFIETMEKNMQSLQREMKDMKRWKFQMQKEGQDTRQMKEEPRKTTTNNGRRCYICGADKHLRRHCPMQRDTTFQSDPRQERTKVNGPKSKDMSQGKSRRTDQHSRIVNSIKESGAY